MGAIANRELIQGRLSYTHRLSRSWFAGATGGVDYKLRGPRKLNLWAGATVGARW